MVSIRLSRVGRKNQPLYRVVVVPKHKDPWGDVLEIVGNYNPRKKPRELILNADRIKYWLSKGAEASDTVWNLLVDEKIVEGKKHSVTHISKTRRDKAAGVSAQGGSASGGKAEADKKAEAPAPEAPKA
jgi:small subunit ribosomal protein S16